MLAGHRNKSRWLKQTRWIGKILAATKTKGRPETDIVLAHQHPTHSKTPNYVSYCFIFVHLSQDLKSWDTESYGPVMCLSLGLGDKASGEEQLLQPLKWEQRAFQSKAAPRPQMTMKEKNYSLLGKGNEHQVVRETVNIHLRKQKFPTFRNVQN